MEGKAESRAGNDEKYERKIVELQVPEGYDQDSFWRITDPDLTAEFVTKEFSKKNVVYIVSFKKGVASYLE